MTSANFERIVQEYYEHIDANRYDDLFQLFADDIVYYRPGKPPIKGMEDFKEFYREQRPLQNGSHTIETIFEINDTVIVQGSFTGQRHQEDIAFRFADFHIFDENGKITERHTYTDLGSV